MYSLENFSIHPFPAKAAMLSLLATLVVRNTNVATLHLLQVSQAGACKHARYCNREGVLSHKKRINNKFMQNSPQLQVNNLTFFLVNFIINLSLLTRSRKGQKYK